MGFYAISALLAATVLVSLSIITFIKSSQKYTARLFVLMNIVICFWVVGCFGECIALSKAEAEAYDKILYIGAAFAHIVYLHLILHVTNTLKKKIKILYAGYFLSFLFLVLNLTPALRTYFIKDVVKLYDFRYISVPNIGWYLYLAFYLSFGNYMLYVLFKSFLKAEGFLKQQLKYFFLSTFVIVNAGILYFALVLKWLSLPIDNIFTILYVIATSYAITRYQLMDIKIAITRFGLFVFVYSLVLGFPFFIGHLYPEKWILPVSIMAVLATAGPYIYLYLQKRAENKLLQEQKQYQNTLRQASLGMGRIKELNRLLELMVHILSKTVRMTHCEIYLVDKEVDAYDLKAFRGNTDKIIETIKTESPLVRYLKRSQMPLVTEEFKYKEQYSDNNEAEAIKKILLGMDAVLVVPSFIQDQLLAFITFGEKKSREAYSADDLIIFSILANQAALAIENCIYWEAEKVRMKEAGLQQRLVSLDAMASSFAHEVHNPVQGCMLDLGLIKEDIDESGGIDPGVKEEILKSVARVFKNVERISNMILSMLDFSRKTSGDLLPLSIYDVIRGFSELVKPKMKEDNVRFNVDVEDNLPSILGDKVQLEEIFVNFSLNSIHAVVKNEKSNRVINLKVFRRNNHLRLEFSDNGYGIKKGMLEDIFLVSVTTKASTEGTGLGLYRVRKIVELHNGKVWAESEGEGKGAKFIMEIPVYTGEMQAKENHVSSLF